MFCFDSMSIDFAHALFRSLYFANDYAMVVCHKILIY